MNLSKMVRCVEIHKGNLILAKAKYLVDFIPKVKGLMFCKPLTKGNGVVLVAPKQGILDTAIHMIFVFFPIDIVWLNENMEIVDYRRSVIPFTPFISPAKPAKYVLELPRNTIRHLKVGDKLEFKEI